MFHEHARSFQRGFRGVPKASKECRGVLGVFQEVSEGSRGGRSMGFYGRSMQFQGGLRRSRGLPRAFRDFLEMFLQKRVKEI